MTDGSGVSAAFCRRENHREYESLEADRLGIVSLHVWNAAFFCAVVCADADLKGRNLHTVLP